MQLLRLEKVKKNYRVILEEKPLGILDKRELYSAGLDTDLPEESEEKLVTDSLGDVLRESIHFKAYETCVKMLAVTEYSAGELRFKLRFRGYAEEVIDVVIERLYANGYISDERYVESYVRSYAGKKGKRSILFELEQKGLGVSNLESLVDRIYAEEGLSETAARDALLEKKFRNADPEDPAVQRRKRAFLYRRGFRPDTNED